MKVEHTLLLFVLHLAQECLSLSSRLTLDCAGQKVPKDRKYIPSLITLSRINSTRFKVYLRCQRLNQIDQSPLQGEYIDVEEQFEYDNQDEMHYAKYLSMNCGDARESGLCFNPAITESDLLQGMVCIKTGRGYCRNSMVVVSKDRPRDQKASGAGIGALHWVFGLLGVVIGTLGVGIAICLPDCPSGPKETSGKVKYQCSLSVIPEGEDTDQEYACQILDTNHYYGVTGTEEET
eukprot:maker-scaffold1364_size45483-snap-gene-0.11 protein:Tk09912 transcript:maker-scaffold1364_size45483-snap-gene-0.11-mRNA-1 annotation:"intron-binding protein aquarius isoform x1"